MSTSVNKVTLLGNLGQEPELKTLTAGATICNLSVATNEQWIDEKKGVQERVEWHRVQVWGRAADACSKYLNKGSKVYVEGRIHTRSWEDKEGKKQWTTNIVATHVIFLDGKRASGNPAPEEHRSQVGGGR